MRNMAGDEFNRENCDLKYGGLCDRLTKLEGKEEVKRNNKWSLMWSIVIMLITSLLNIINMILTHVLKGNGQ